MRWAIDLLLLAILALCTWNGYKKGLIMGIGGLVCIAVSLYGACLLSGTFSYEVVSAIKPFANGYIEHVISNDVSKELGLVYGEEIPLTDRQSISDAINTDPEVAHDFAVLTYENLGIYESAAQQMAEEAEEYADANKVTLKDAVVDVVCDRAVYVAGVILCFFIILIFLTFIGNIPNLAFRLPNMEEVDEIGGSILGVMKGVLFCMLLAWALKFLGIIIGTDTMSETILGKLFIKIGFISKFIGI